MKAEIKWVGTDDRRVWGLIQTDDWDWSTYSPYYTFWGCLKTKRLYFKHIRRTTVKDRSFNKSVKEKRRKYTQVQTVISCTIINIACCLLTKQWKLIAL